MEINWQEIFTEDNIKIFILVLTLIVSLSGNGVQGIKGLITKLMLFAEKKASTELEKQGAITGAEKKALVVNAIYSRFPTWLRGYISENYISSKIESIISDLADLKDDGTLNESNKEAK